MAKISCIIPTCDRREFLKEAIESVLRQTLEPDEIIVVNNGKKPINLPENILKEVILFNIIPYAGVAQARNFGACLAKGDYLAFLDDDDMWTPKYLENVSKAIHEGALCIVSREDQLLNGEISHYKNAHGRLTIKNILTFNPGAGGPNIVISKDVFFRVGGFDPKLPPSEDKSLILEVLKNGIEVKTLPDNSVIVRIHSGARLTGAVRIAEGIYQFTHKYSDLMSWADYLYNWKKIFYYRLQAGEKVAIFPYFLVSGVLGIVKLIKK